MIIPYIYIYIVGPVCPSGLSRPVPSRPVPSVRPSVGYVIIIIVIVIIITIVINKYYYYV